MDEKTKLALIGIVSLVFIATIAIGAFLLFRPTLPKTFDRNRPSTSQVGSTDQGAPQPDITLAPKNGKVVLYDVDLKDFTQLSTKTAPDGSSILQEKSDYSLKYSPKNGYFNIEFNSIPSQERIVEVEREILQLLEITEDQACRLSIEVLIPSQENPSLKEPYMLSFCSHDD